LPIDLARARSFIEPDKNRPPLARRPDHELVFAADVPVAGPSLLLDTTVYIDTLQGRTPDALDALLETRPIAHISVAVGELAHQFGRLDPGHPGTAAALRELGETIESIPAHQLETPNQQTVLEAGILAGLLCRRAGFPRGTDTSTALNDATLYLHALRRGHTVVTRNIRDFDWLNQLLPVGHVIFYRQTP
jgi:predicted nucleic acid-binding protein